MVKSLLFNHLVRCIVFFVVAVSLTACGGNKSRNSDTGILSPSPIVTSQSSSQRVLSSVKSLSSASQLSLSSIQSLLSSSQKSLSSIQSSNRTSSSSSSVAFSLGNASSKGVKPQPINVTAWLGEKDSIIQFPSPTNNLVYKSAQTLGCNDFTISCPEQFITSVDSSNILDPNLTATNHAFLALAKNGYQAKRNASAQAISTKYNSVTAVFNNKLWMASGSSIEHKGSVWSSTNGSDWFLETDQADFETNKAKMIAFKNELWIFGDSGYGWSSTDGVHWKIKTTTAPGLVWFGGFDIEVFQNKLWMAGSAIEENTIWSSDDGITWKIENNATGFDRRDGLEMVAFHNKLWIIGGYGCCGALSDIWSSDDGMHWQKVVDDAPFGVRSYHSVIEMNGQLWLTGNSTINYNDEWTSKDGVNWTLVTDGPALKLLTLNNRLFGISDNGDIWSSIDGAKWVQEIHETNLPARIEHQTISTDTKIITIGGRNNKEIFADIRSSSDGVDWKLETDAAPFGPRTGHQIVFYKGKYWLMGGNNGTAVKNDIWSSIDGLTWILEKQNASFSPRCNHAATVFNNKIWIVGGRDEQGALGDVWSSDDGSNWVRTYLSPDDLNFSRFNHILTSINGKLLVLHGYNNHLDLSELDNTRASNDGVTWWSDDDLNVQLLPRGDLNYKPFIVDNTLWLIGTENQVGILLRTTDGKSWARESVSIPFSPRFGATLTKFKNELYLIGGGNVSYIYSYYYPTLDPIYYSSVKGDVWKSSDNGVSWRKGMKLQFTFE